MPALIRQEIGIIMFILLVLALFDSSLNKYFRYSLIYVFSAGLVLSHYSTAYICLIVIVFTYLISWILRKSTKIARLSPRLIPWHIIVILALMIAFWEGPITHTAYNASTVAFTSVGQLGQIFSPNVIESGVKQAFIAPPNVNTDTTIEQAYQQAVKNRSGPSSDYYSNIEIGNYSHRL